MAILNPIAIRAQVREYSKFEQEDFSEGRRGIILGKLNSSLQQKVMRSLDSRKPENIADENRRLVLGFIFGDENMVFAEMSSKQLNFSQWRALEKWIFGTNPKTKSDGSWVVRQNFQPEAFWVLNVARAIQDVSKGGYLFGRLLDAMRDYMLKDAPYSPNDFSDDNSNLVANSLHLPGAIPFEKPLYTNTKPFVPAFTIVNPPIGAELDADPEGDLQELDAGDDDEFII